MDKFWHETNNIDECDTAQFNLMQDIQCLKEDVERLRGVVYAVAVDAHMAGQFDAEIDPSFSNAQSYAEKYKQGEQNG